MSFINRYIRKFRKASRTSSFEMFNIVLRALKIRMNILFGRVNSERSIFSPTSVSIMPTQRCNLQCKFCYIWGSRVDRIELSRELKQTELTLEQWYNVISQLEQCRPKPLIQIIGGEPLLWEHISELMSSLKSKGFIVDLVSNGVLADKFIPELVELKIDRIRFSIDGIGKTHDNIRGIGIFERCKDSLFKLMQQKRRINSSCSIEIILTICRENQMEIYESVSEFWSWGIDGLQINHLFLSLPEQLEIHRKFLSENFGNSVCYWNFPSEADSLPSSEIVIPQLKRIRLEFPQTAFVPNFDQDMLNLYYTDYPRFVKIYKGSCTSLWNGLTIRSDGTVESCLDIPLGSVHDCKIMSIFNNNIQRKARKLFHRNRSFPICTSCCNFYNKLV